MEPMYLSIRTKETGQRIKKLLIEKGYTVRDVQDAYGFENPQAIYKWISGISLPTVDNLYALSELFQVSMDEMLCGNRKKYAYQPKTPQEKRLYAYYVELKKRAA